MNNSVLGAIVVLIIAAVVVVIAIQSGTGLVSDVEKQIPDKDEVAILLEEFANDGTILYEPSGDGSFEGPQGSLLPPYRGGVSRGDGWEINWEAPGKAGPRPIDAVRAAIQNLQHRQRTNYQSVENAKLLYDLLKVVERYDGERLETSVDDLLDN